MNIFLNIFNNSKFKLFFFITFLFILYAIICATSYAKAITTDLSSNILRLHIIANSDSSEDQQLKYSIRDNIIKYMNSINFNCKTKQETIDLINKNINNLNKIAKQTIIDNGYNYDVNIKIDNCYFPTKQYGNISLPAGQYNALKIEIGAAIGKNWWCVIFPSLCFIDLQSPYFNDTSEELLKTNLSNETYELISNTSSSNLKFKFKILELLANNKTISAN